MRSDTVPMGNRSNAAHKSRTSRDRGSRKCDIFTFIEYSSIEHFRLQGQTDRVWIYSFARFLPARKSGPPISYSFHIISELSFVEL